MNFCPPALPREAEAGGNAGRDSIRKILWILLKMGSDFVQQAPHESYHFSRRPGQPIAKFG